MSAVTQLALSKHEDEAGADRSLDEEIINEGVFSWTAAWCMMIWILCTISSVVMGVLTFQGAGFERISEEISFIRARNPPYGPVEQPNMELKMRDVNMPFRYLLPQVPLFFCLASASVGLFTVSYFINFMLLEDQGHKKVVDICKLISKGVVVYLERTIPVICIFLFLAGWYVFVTAGWGTLSCFIAGAALNLISARIGVGMTVQGTGRLAHAMGGVLPHAVQIGIRTGSIGGLLATSLAIGGMAIMWLWLLDTNNLSGFGSGASIVSFYLRVGGGIFAKGAEIGSNLVCEMDDHKAADERRVFELQQRIVELEQTRRDRAKKGLAESDEDMMDQLRMMEEEMQDVAALLHPIEYLDAVGENICDVAGTCADLFESMVLILSTSAIIGSKGAAVPHFTAGLPFWIAGAGNLFCSAVAWRVHCTDKYQSRQLRISLRMNLVIVIIAVQCVQIAASYLEWLRGSIDFSQFWHYTLISLLGQVVPEVCVFFAEIFTSVDYPLVRSLAQNSGLGVVQVVLQGLGQGFASTLFPAVTMVGVVMITYELEGHYGLALLSSASVSGTGFQGGIASYGAISTIAHKIVHLTTYHSMTRHRANICAALGDSAAHGGNIISAVNAFSAVFNVAMTLLAQAYTRLGMNYQMISGAPVSEWSQAGLLLGVVMTMLFTANTIISCLETSKAFMRFCKESKEVDQKRNLPFPYSHIQPLTILTSFGTVTSMRMVFTPMINTLAVPMLGGWFLGLRGLLFLLSGSNVLILCLSIFLNNSGQSWVAAKKYILFGSLKDQDGKVIGPDSAEYENLGVGEMIGGPFEDVAGPALNNFIKFLAVFALVTEGLYEETPENTWIYGFACCAGSLILVAFSKFGLTLILNCLTSFLRQRQLQRARDEHDEELSDEEDGDGEEGRVGIEDA